jgi:L-aminopeptidase/D-esterase-like protein
LALAAQANDDDAAFGQRSRPKAIFSMRNLITDVPGVLVGNAHDPRLASGVTVAVFERAAVAGMAVPGGAPANRDTACLGHGMTIGAVDAIVLSGGSGFGLDAASGVQAWLRERGRGFGIRDVRIPIVPGAICFDLLNGGDKDWGRFPPYRDLAYAATENAATDFALGTAGGGSGATTVDLKGGLGSASALTSSGFTVGALAIVNALGSAVVGGGPHFWAAPYERDAEFGGLGAKGHPTEADLRLAWKGAPATGTTIALVATDADLTSGEAHRLALMANAGLARALRLVHAPLDGDTVFSAATGHKPMTDRVAQLTEMGAVAADCLARAVARGVFEATALPFPGALPAWRDLFAPS